MATAKTVKEPMPAFTGRYASIRKRIWKNTVDLYLRKGKDKSINGRTYKTEQGYRTAVFKNIDAKMKKIDMAENAIFPKEIEIQVNWAKGSMGVMQATAEMEWRDQNGFHSLTGDKTKGYGYDKESSAVSYVLNEAPFGIRIALEIARLSNPPYGIGGRSKTSTGVPYWESGVGMSSFLTVFQKVGYTYKHYWSDRHDVYVLTRKR